MSDISPDAWKAVTCSSCGEVYEGFLSTEKKHFKNFEELEEFEKSSTSKKIKVNPVFKTCPKCGTENEITPELESWTSYLLKKKGSIKS